MLKLEFKLVKGINKLLSNVGYDSEQAHFRLCTEGGNNKAYFVEIKNAKFFVKIYFPDKHKRLQKEWVFSKYAVSAKIKCTPRPIACDVKNNIAIYEFINGKKPSLKQITRSSINQAIDFFKALNQKKHLSTASLSIASEACFKFSNHFLIIESRLLNFSLIKLNGSLKQEYTKFVTNLCLRWEKLKKIIISKSIKSRYKIETCLDKKFWCVSPSDFGFHNAIRQSFNNLYFIDFEHAGWDDPAKMAIDFLLQPSIPIDIKYHNFFISKILNFFPEYEEMNLRIQLLYPILAFKWCCIMLNCFMPWWKKKVFFLESKINLKDLQESRLKKAKIYLDQAFVMANCL